jgi:hypothetical protein
MDFKEKYLKYKSKYLKLKKQYGGANCLKFGFQQYTGQCWHDALSMTMMQSDALKDTFISQLTVLDIDIIHQKLIGLFSPENINKNAYLLPFTIYLYYLINKGTSRMEKLITEFLRLSKEYITNHKERALNRLQYDPQMGRYSTDAHPYDMFDDLQSLQHELRTASPHQKTGLRRRASVYATVTCTNKIREIYDLLFSFSEEQLNLVKKEGGGNYEQILAMEILNMYIIRSSPSNENMYIDTFNVFLRSPGYITDTVWFENYKSRVNYDLLKKLINSNLIGIIVTENVNIVDSHAISLYKCDEQELLYDNNAEGPILVKWIEHITTYISSHADDSQLAILDGIAQSSRTYDTLKVSITQLLFVRKRAFHPGDNDKQREIKFILNKINGFLPNNILELLIRRLFELIKERQETIDIYISKIAESSLFDNKKFEDILKIIKE